MKLSALHNNVLYEGRKSKSKKRKYNVEASEFMKPGEELARTEYLAAVSPDTSSVPAVDPYNAAPRPVDKPGSAGPSSREIRARRVEGF